MKGKFIQTGILILTIFTAFPSASHKGNQQESGKQRQIAHALYEKATALAPEMFHSPPSPIHPFTMAGRQRTDWDAASGELIRSWARLFRHEIQHSCPCEIDENALVRDHIARGMVSSYVRPFLKKGTIKITEIGSQYGATAAILKGSAEAVETAIALTTPLKGIHLFCEPIDALIFFFVRKAEIYGRVFKNSGLLNQNRFAMSLQTAWARRKMKRAQQKVLLHLDLDRVDIDSEGLQSVNEDGRKNNRNHYIERLASRVNPLLSQIKEIDDWMETQTVSPETEKKMKARKEKLYRKIAKLAVVSRKDFFGSRYGLSLYLFSRKGKKTHLKGHTLPDRLTSYHWLWPLQIQDILERSLVWQATEEARNTHLFPEEDEIRRGLAEEFYENLPEHLRSPNQKEEHIRSVEYMMGDIGRIFDPSISVEKKHFLAFSTEMFLTGFFGHFLQIIHNEMSQNLRFRSQLRLSWKLHKFVRHSRIYADFLFTASLTEDPAALVSYKYEAMENFLVLLKYLTKLSGIAHSVRTAPELFAVLDENLHSVQVSQVSREKRTTFSLIPFKKPTPPLCRDLVKEVR